MQFRQPPPNLTCSVTCSVACSHFNGFALVGELPSRSFTGVRQVSPGEAGAERSGSTKRKLYTSGSVAPVGELPALRQVLSQEKLEQSASEVTGLSSTPAGARCSCRGASRSPAGSFPKAGAERIGRTRLKRYPSSALLLSGCFSRCFTALRQVLQQRSKGSLLPSRANLARQACFVIGSPAAVRSAVSGCSPGVLSYARGQHTRWSPRLFPFLSQSHLLP